MVRPEQQSQCEVNHRAARSSTTGHGGPAQGDAVGNADFPSAGAIFIAWPRAGDAEFAVVCKFSVRPDQRFGPLAGKPAAVRGKATDRKKPAKQTERRSGKAREAG